LLLTNLIGKKLSEEEKAYWSVENSLFNKELECPNAEVQDSYLISPTAIIMTQSL